MLRTIQSDFPDFLFERLTAAVFAPSATERRLRHAISGSSRVLSAYKIAAEARGSGARPDLTGLDNVVLIPHLGSATVETRTAMAELAAANAIAVLAGDAPPTPVT